MGSEGPLNYWLRSVLRVNCTRKLLMSGVQGWQSLPLSGSLLRAELCVPQGASSSLDSKDSSLLITTEWRKCPLKFSVCDKGTNIGNNLGSSENQRLECTLIGLFLSSTLPTTWSLQVLYPGKKEQDWEGCQAIFNPVGQRVFPGCLEGLGAWRKGKGWSGLRPLVLIKVRRCKSIKKTLASNQTPVMRTSEGKKESTSQRLLSD